MIALYLLSAVAGMSFMGLSAILGHFGTGHGGGHGHGGGGHGHGGHAGEAGFDLPLFSPLAIASYITGFGSAGLLLTEGLHVANPYIHVPASLIFAGGFGLSMLVAMAKISKQAEGNTLASLQDAVGTDVEVTIAIPPNGSGEVAYVAGGTRQSCIAAAEAGQGFPQGARVRVTRALEGTLYVTLAGALPAGGASVGEPVEARPPERNKVR